MAAVRPSDDLVARVVAWHNRHPLARRIVPAHVVSVGLVSFPYWAPGLGPDPAAAGSGRVDPTLGGDTSEPAPADAPAPSPGTAAGADTEAASGPAAEAPPASGAVGEAAGARLRDRARARASAAGGASVTASASNGTSGHLVPPGRARRAWRAAFDDDLLDPHTPREVARWALRHGSALRPGSADAPVRDLEPRGRGQRGEGLARLWVFTAAIDLGSQRVRVLVSPHDPRRVLGLRILGRGRLGAWAATLVAGAAGVVAGAVVGLPGFGAGRGPDAGGKVASASAAAAASAPAAATAASAQATTLPTGHATAAPEPAHAMATHPSPLTPPAQPAAPAAPGAAIDTAEVAATTASATPQRDPTEHRVLRVVPRLSEEARRAAREASDAARSERAGRALAQAAPSGAQGAHGAQSPTPERPAATAPAATSAAAAAAPSAAPAARGTPAAAPAAAWAVSTRNLRTRFESEQMLAALRDAAYRGGHGNELKLEVLPSGDDWRAVGWPFATRDEAERLRAALAARGLKAEVVQF